MSPLQVYKEFLLRINKNDTNKNIQIPRGEFVLLFNEQLRSWTALIIEEKESSDKIEDIEEIYESDFELTKIGDKPLFTEFQLPNNFHTKSSCYCVASKGECKNTVLVCWTFKPKNKNINLLTNSNEEPSFEYRETSFSISNNKVLVHKTDFSVDKTYLSYYRMPIELDISGYKRLDGTPSVDVATDLTDINIEQVLDKCAEIVLGRYQNTEGFQIAAKAFADAVKG